MTSTTTSDTETATVFTFRSEICRVNDLAND